MSDPIHSKIPAGLRVIAIVKLISAALLSAVGFGIFHLLGKDLGDTLEEFVKHLHLDPDAKYVNKALAAISGVSPRELKDIGVGILLYALLYIVEGVGLLMARHWAEYLTIIATASLIPLELYEIIRKPDLARIAVLLVNIAIVIYLIYRLRVDRQIEARVGRTHAPDSATDSR